MKGVGLRAKIIVYAEDIKKKCLEEGGALWRDDGTLTPEGISSDLLVVMDSGGLDS